VKKPPTYLIVALLAVGYFTGDFLSDEQVSSTNSNNSDEVTQSQSPWPDSSPASPSPKPSDSASSIVTQPSAEQSAEQIELSGPAIQLNNLLIKGRAPKTGYDRDLFGSSWIDIDRNGCDTRNDILRRDLSEVTFRPGTGNCVVETGKVFDPYTGTEYDFVKSNTGGGMDIDHIVSLSDAWQKGAQQWNSETRKQFANDPLNLVATNQSVNRSKSSSDAASWLPPNKSIRCAFVARQISIKSAYQLWVTQAEYDAMTRVLSSCPNQPIATSGQLRP
jgi:hypothetical protein